MRSFQFDFIYNKLCSMKNITEATRIKQENFDTDFSTEVTMSEKCISQFNSDEESWESYIETLEQYFVLHGTANDKKKSALSTFMGPKTYQLLKDLLNPQKPSEKNYQQIVEVLSKHLTPKRTTIAERFKFSKRDQLDGESINNYVAAQRKLSATCNYDKFLDDALTERFVCGLKSRVIQNRLLTEADLSFSTAIQLANNLQQAYMESASVQSSCAGFSEPAQLNELARGCYCCSGRGHGADKCFFKDFQCHFCDKLGHLKCACKTRTKRDQSKSATRQNQEQGLKTLAHEVSVTSNDCFNLYSFMDSYNPLCITLNVNNSPVQMDLDTGSALSIISYEEFSKKFKHLPLQCNNLILKTYTGEKVSPMGVCKVIVSHNNKFFNLELYVLKSKGPALFNREWLNRMQLNLNEFTDADLKQRCMTPEFNLSDEMVSELNANYAKSKQEFNCIESAFVDNDCCFNCDDELQTLMRKHIDVFSYSIGCLKKITSSLHLKENATPKFCKARPIPHSLKSKVETELKNLQSEGIIQPISWSEWATPIVPVMKKNGAVCICGDFKVTINSQLKVEQYPLPKFEDIFANLARGKQFSKIDLKNAYLRMTMDEDSQKLLVINTHKGLYQYARLPFGVASSPALWQRAIEQVLQGISGVQCLLDDIIVT